MNLDLIVVGDGLAACTLLLSLPQTFKVGVISNMKSLELSSERYRDELLKLMSIEHDFDSHIANTITEGDGLCNEEVVRKVVAKTPSIMQWLRDMGLKMPLIMMEEGSCAKKKVQIELFQDLIQKINALPNLVWIGEHEALELISDGSSVSGIFAQNVINEKVSIFYASKIVLADRGVIPLYPNPINSNISQYSGIAMAWRAGAAIENLEFIQFSPTLMLPNASERNIPNKKIDDEKIYLDSTESIRVIQNAYLKLNSNNALTRLVYSEMQSQNSLNTFIEIERMAIEEKLGLSKTAVSFYQNSKVNNSNYRVPIFLTANQACGGIATDLAGSTSIRGLYALGEIAHTGLHGANTLGGNLMLESIAMGRSCAKVITSCIVSPQKTQQERIIFTGAIPSISESASSDIKEILWTCAGVVRNNKNLIGGYEALKEIEYKEKIFQPYGRALRIRNIFDTANLIFRSAIGRCETRGCHINDDYPLKTSIKTTSISGFNRAYYWGYVKRGI